MPQIKRDAVFLNCRIETKTMARIEAYMKKTRLTKTAIVELAIEEYLDRVMPEYVEPESEENG